MAAVGLPVWVPGVWADPVWASGVWASIAVPDTDHMGTVWADDTWELTTWGPDTWEDADEPFNPVYAVSSNKAVGPRIQRV
jgi:hypothetical protein